MMQITPTILYLLPGNKRVYPVGVVYENIYNKRESQKWMDYNDILYFMQHILYSMTPLDIGLYTMNQLCQWIVT